MAIEESSVVAAASLVAKFWSSRGGFKAEVVSTTKIGQVHFMFVGDKAKLSQYFQSKKEDLRERQSFLFYQLFRRPVTRVMDVIVNRWAFYGDAIAHGIPKSGRALFPDMMKSFPPLFDTFPGAERRNGKRR